MQQVDDGDRHMTNLWSLDLISVSSHEGVFLGHCRTLLDLQAQLVLSSSDCTKRFATPLITNVQIKCD